MAKSVKKTAARKKTKTEKKPKMVWLSHYADRVDWHETFTGKPLGEMWDEAASAYGGNVCCDFLGAQMSYEEMDGWIRHLASGLRQRGFGPGHQIGLLLPNVPYFVAAYYAIAKIGATVVNFNPLYTLEEVTYQAENSEISAMVTLDLEMMYGKAVKLVENGIIEKLIVCPFARLLPMVTGLLFRLFKSSQIASVETSQYIVTFDEMIDNDGLFETPAIDPDNDVALLQYTGGTTGTPKGAMLTHSNLTINVQQSLRWNPDAKLGKERIMGILPLFHVFAMTSVLNYGVQTGAMMILVPKFDLPKVVKLFRQLRPTIMPGVPTLYQGLLDYDGLEAGDLSSLEVCISGGAALPAELRTEFEAFANCRLVEGYGLSETSPLVACNPITGESKANSIGQPVPATVISIRSLDAPKKEMPIGEAGEICVKGPQVMKGYWKNPEATRQTFVGRFFRTGDVGYMDEDGYIFIIDRIKDMINCSGYKVYPRRIEDALYEHPAVAETVVIGIPDEYRGEAPKAFVRLKKGLAATAEELLAHLEARISKIEMPEEIEFRSELPKTMIGKLSKKDLRKAVARSKEQAGGT